MIETGQVDATSVVAIIRAVGSVAKSVDIGNSAAAVAVVGDVIAEVAKGKDGVVGTDDDLIPVHVVNMMKMFVQQGTVHDLAVWSLDFRTGGCLSRLFCTGRKP
jgi:hypothetical protein